MSLFFEKKIFVPFHLGDPAGILFFAHLFSLSHEVYEFFIQEKLHICCNDWFHHSQWAVPIKSSNSIYYLPMKVGLYYFVRLSVIQIGRTSFVLRYQFFKECLLHGQVETVHVFCERSSFKKMAIPSFIQQNLSLFI